MTPIDPTAPARENSRSMEPPYSGENPNLEAVEEGLGTAEDEARDAVEETYASTTGDLEEDDDLDSVFMDDEDESAGEEKPYAPELAAMHSSDDFEAQDGNDPDQQVERAEEYRGRDEE